MKIARNKYLYLVLSLLLFQALPVAAQTSTGDNQSTASTTAASVPKVLFEKYSLPNGLQVILHVDRKLPVVHVNQWFHVGSKNEKVGRTGFAHLFEHMMFEGSKNADAKYFAYVEKAGANLFEGGVNGTTSWDRTNYFATVPSGNLEYLLSRIKNWLMPKPIACAGTLNSSNRSVGLPIRLRNSGPTICRCRKCSERQTRSRKPHSRLSMLRPRSTQCPAGSRCCSSAISQRLSQGCES